MQSHTSLATSETKPQEQTDGRDDARATLLECGIRRRERIDSLQAQSRVHERPEERIFVRLLFTVRPASADVRERLLAAVTRDSTDRPDHRIARPLFGRHGRSFAQLRGPDCLGEYAPKRSEMRGAGSDVWPVAANRNCALVYETEKRPGTDRPWSSVARPGPEEGGPPRQRIAAGHQ